MAGDEALVLQYFQQCLHLQVLATRLAGTFELSILTARVNDRRTPALRSMRVWRKADGIVIAPVGFA